MSQHQSVYAEAPAGLGARTAAFLRDRYPKDRAKLIARDFRVSPGTAERWLAGYAPATWHIEELYKRFGQDFARALFIEAFAERDARLSQLEQVSQLEQALSQKTNEAISPWAERERPPEPGSNGHPISSQRASSHPVAYVQMPPLWIGSNPGRILSQLIATIPPEPGTARVGKLFRLALRRLGLQR